MDPALLTDDDLAELRDDDGHAADPYALDADDLLPLRVLDDVRDSDAWD
jgi:hypothetical protein